MLPFLVELLPSALGFLGFFLFRWFFVGGKAPRKKAESDTVSSDKKLSDDQLSELSAESSEEHSEPEPGPEPDLSDESPVASSSSPKAVPLEDELAEVAEEVSPVKDTEEVSPLKDTCEVGQRSKKGIAVGAIVTYLVVTAAVFVHFCAVTNKDATNAVGTVKVKRNDAELQAQREKFDLPYWKPSEREADHVGDNASQIVTLALTRQFMTLRGKEGQVVYYKSAYWGELAVGTPPETFKVVFDTGSGHLILPSTYCRSETCRAHKRYKRSKSLTAKDIDHDGTIVPQGSPRDQITVSFGTGEVTGVFVDDTVCLDESALPPLHTEIQPNDTATAANQEMDTDLDVHKLYAEAREAGEEAEEELSRGCFKLRVVLATQMSEEPFRDFHFDGILGLGLSGLSQAFEFNFPGMMSNFVQKLGAPLPHIFAVFLAKHAGESSELIIGGHSKRRQGGPLHWSPVIMPEHGHWMLSIKNIYVDGELIEFCRDGTCRAVADTGTSLLAVPSRAFPEIYEALRHNAPVAGFCNETGPALQIELAGDNFTVSMRPEDYTSLEPISKPKSQVRDWFRRFFYAKGWPFVKEPQDFRRDMYCKPLLMSMDLPKPLGPKLFILGEPLLRRYYTVYDAEAPAVGWAQAYHTEAKQAEIKEETDEWWDAEEDSEGDSPADGSS